MVEHDDYGYSGYIEIISTFALRAQLRTQGLQLPELLDTQLFAEAREYTFINKQGKKETRHDVGLRSSFD